MKHLTIFLLLALSFASCQSEQEEQAAAVAGATVNQPTGDYADAAMAVAIVCNDIDASIEFYEDVLGFESTGGFDIAGDFGKKLGLVDDDAFSVKTFTTGSHAAAVTFKLVSFESPRVNHPRPTHINDDTGVQYLTLMVNDIKPFMRRLKKADITILSDEDMTVGKDEDQDFVLIQDPDGTFIELIETPR